MTEKATYLEHHGYIFISIKHFAEFSIVLGLYIKSVIIHLRLESYTTSIFLF